MKAEQHSGESHGIAAASLNTLATLSTLLVTCSCGVFQPVSLVSLEPVAAFLTQKIDHVDQMCYMQVLNQQRATL